jgi:hypothetical protein
MPGASADMNSGAVTRPGDFEHRYFIGAAAVIAVIIVAGFAPNYVLRTLHDRRHLTLWVNMHGLVMASWIVLFVAQTWVVAKRRVELHRKLGVLGAGLIGLVPLVGIPVLVNAATRKAHGAHGDRFWLMLAAFDGVSLLTFAGLAGCAILLRRRSDIHKRLMLLATLSLLGPAFGRLTSYANGLRGDNDLVVLFLVLTCLFASIGLDTFRRRRLHPAFAWGATAVVVADLLTYTAKTLI